MRGRKDPHGDEVTGEYAESASQHFAEQRAVRLDRAKTDIANLLVFF